MNRLLTVLLACSSLAGATTNEQYVSTEGWTAETPAASTKPPQVEIRDGRVFVNGAPIRLRGVTAPSGLASEAARVAAITAWKRANVNALLVPANANPAEWLPLCDRLGLYVVTATPESPSLTAHPSYLFSTSSVTVVSNPAPMQAFLKAGARPGAFDRRTLVNAALDTPAEQPILAVDLAPAAGDLSLIWQEIYWHPRLLGAFLAAWVDATTGEVRKVYQPILIERRRMKPGDVAIRVTNRHHHLSLDAFEPRWAVLRDGGVIEQGVLPPLALVPNAQPEVPLPVSPIDTPVPGAAYTLRIDFHTRSASAWAPAGHEIAYEELPLDVAVPAPSSE
jgi:hypothetical protein